MFLTLSTCGCIRCPCQGFGSGGLWRWPLLKEAKGFPLLNKAVSDFPVFFSTHEFCHCSSPCFPSCPVGDGGSEQLERCLAARQDQPPQQSVSSQFFTLAFPVFVTVCHYKKSIISVFVHINLPYDFWKLHNTCN